MRLVVILPLRKVICWSTKRTLTSKHTLITGVFFQTNWKEDCQVFSLIIFHHVAEMNCRFFRRNISTYWITSSQVVEMFPRGAIILPFLKCMQWYYSVIIQWLSWTHIFSWSIAWFPSNQTSPYKTEWFYCVLFAGRQGNGSNLFQIWLFYFQIFHLVLFILR